MFLLNYIKYKFYYQIEIIIFQLDKKVKNFNGDKFIVLSNLIKYFSFFILFDIL